MNEIFYFRRAIDDERDKVNKVLTSYKAVINSRVQLAGAGFTEAGDELGAIAEDILNTAHGFARWCNWVHDESIKAIGKLAVSGEDFSGWLSLATDTVDALKAVQADIYGVYALIPDEYKRVKITITN